MCGFAKNVVDELNWYSAFVQVKRFALMINVSGAVCIIRS